MRQEFRIATKRTALARSEGRCEAIGHRYGLLPGMRCRASISHWRVQYDHYPRGAHDPHPETRSIDNCVATCPACNAWAAHHTDTPREAKMKRVQANVGRLAMQLDRPVKKPGSIRGRGFDKSRTRAFDGTVKERS